MLPWSTGALFLTYQTQLSAINMQIILIRLVWQQQGHGRDRCQCVMKVMYDTTAAASGQRAWAGAGRVGPGSILVSQADHDLCLKRQMGLVPCIQAVDTVVI